MVKRAMKPGIRQTAGTATSTTPMAVHIRNEKAREDIGASSSLKLVFRSFCPSMFPAEEHIT